MAYVCRPASTSANTRRHSMFTRTYRSDQETVIIDAHAIVGQSARPDACEETNGRQRDAHREEGAEVFVMVLGQVGLLICDSFWRQLGHGGMVARS